MQSGKQDVGSHTLCLGDRAFYFEHVFRQCCPESILSGHGFVLLCVILFVGSIPPPPFRMSWWNFVIACVTSNRSLFLVSSIAFQLELVNVSNDV
jgi:hypothetical protein